MLRTESHRRAKAPLSWVNQSDSQLWRSQKTEMPLLHDRFTWDYGYGWQHTHNTPESWLRKVRGPVGRGHSYADIKCLPRKEGLKENLILALKSLIYSHCFCQYDISQGHLGRETLSGENAALRLACGAFLDCWLTWEGPAHCGQCYPSTGRWFWAV